MRQHEEAVAQASTSKQEEDARQHHMACFDVTRDLLCSFYAAGNWRAQHKVMKVALELALGTKLRDNGNSFRSCFQFVEQAQAGRLYRRFKVYDKGLSLLTSRSATHPLGMNTEALFQPSYLIGRELMEAKHCGWTRLEISFYADSADAAAGYFSERFVRDARRDLDTVLRVMNEEPDLCHRIAFRDLFESFQHQARGRQLYV